MSNFFTGLKTLVVGLLTTVTAAFAPVTLHTQNTISASPIAKVASESAGPIKTQKILVKPSQSPTPASSTKPLNGDSYIYVSGTYSYLGQSIKYLFLVPKKGGDFSGSIDGVCQGQAGGRYTGGNGGQIRGEVSGTCNMFGYHTQGSTKFSGHLYPDSKTVTLDADNSPIHGFSINYN